MAICVRDVYSIEILKKDKIRMNISGLTFISIFKISCVYNFSKKCLLDIESQTINTFQLTFIYPDRLTKLVS